MDRTYWSACAAAFLTVTSYAALIGALPYALESWGHPAFAVGFLLGAFPAGILLARVLGLRSVDRAPWRAMLLTGLLLTLVGLALTAIAAGSPWLALGRFIHGAGFALVTMTAMACVGARAPAARRGALLGRYGALTGLSMVIFPPAGLWLAQNIGLDAAFIVAAGAAVLAFIPALLIDQSSQPRPSASDTTFRAPPAGLMIGMALCAIPLGALESTLPYMAEPRNLQHLPAIYLAWGFAVVAGRLVGGSLADRVSGAVPAALLCAVAGLGLAMALRGDVAFVTSCIVGGIGVGIATSMLTAAISRSAPVNAQGRALGIATLLHNLMFAVGAPLGGGAFQVAETGPLAVSALALVTAAALTTRAAAKPLGEVYSRSEG